MQLLSQLLETVNYLHGRGSAHLGLDGDVVRVTGSDTPANQPAAAADGGGGGGGGRSSAALTLIGLGAAVRLQSAPQRMDESRRDTLPNVNGGKFRAIWRGHTLGRVQPSPGRWRRPPRAVFSSRTAPSHSRLH